MIGEKRENESSLAFFISALLAFFALIPPVGFRIPNPDMMVWTAMMVFAGFLGVLLLFTRVNAIVKIAAIGGYVNCFLSAAPVLSFTSYIPLLFCCYFYLFCTKVKSWTPIFNTLAAIIILECLFIFIQILRKDTLLNFGFGGRSCFGTIGSQMQLESFLVVVSALAIQRRRMLVFALVVGSSILYTVLYGLHIHITSSFMSRLPCWKQAFLLANEHPFTGWGIGSFKFIFTPLSKGVTENFRSAHNEWVQMLFETGYPGLILMAGVFGYLVYRLIKGKRWLLLVALTALAMDISVHFPLRTLQCPLIIVAFLAYLEQNLRGIVKK